MFCEFCGRQIEDDSIFCPECGKRVAEAPAQGASPAAKETTQAIPSTADTARRPSANKNVGGSGGKVVPIVLAVAFLAAVIVLAIILVPQVKTLLDGSSEQEQAQQQEQSEQSSQSVGAAQEEGQALKDAADETVASSVSNDFSDAFYGAFSFASRKKSAAQEHADELNELGYPSEVVKTTDWDELNNEEYYSVTTGTWSMESEAQAMVEKLKDLGYDDACVKYSGEKLANMSNTVQLTVETKKGKTLSGYVRRDSDDCVIYDSSSYKYSKSELEAMELSDAELCIAWNEPFARLGYHFKNPDLQAYFESCSWYVDSRYSGNLTGAAASNNTKLREIAQSSSSAKRWLSLATS